MPASRTFVIVGASLAGAKAAERLRKGDAAARIQLVGAEEERPYERPPLSKGYLLGKEARDSAYVHDEGWYSENGVDLVLGRKAIDLDIGGHAVRLDDGSELTYDKVLLATGARPRRLAVDGADLDGVLYLRALADADRLRAAVRAGGRVVVVGGGWIGLETAAAANAHGCAVTVVEPMRAPLLPALGEEVGGFFADLHRAHGVELRLGREVRELRGSGRVSTVVTDDGAELPADVVIVGVGIEPNTELAEAAGLTVSDGVVVDQSLRTADPDVYAAGDVARSHIPRYGTAIRVEHWANALRGGIAAARSMLGEDVTYNRLPYFFSDQYDAGMEFAGWFPPGGYDRVVTRGAMSTDGFHAFWVDGERVAAGMHVNRADDGIKPIEELLKAESVDLGRLADPAVPLSDV